MKYQSFLILLLSILVTFGLANAQTQPEFDPFKLTPAMFDDVSDRQRITDRNGNIFRIDNTKYSRGLRIRIVKDGREKWAKHGIYYTLRGSDGTVDYQQTWRLGIKHGEYKSFTRKGQLKFHYHFDNGKKQGSYTHYRKDGSIFEEWTYKDDKKHGKRYEYYHEKGAIKGPVIFETDYVEGKRHGMHFQYNKRGKLVARALYQKGKQVGKTEWLH